MNGNKYNPEETNLNPERQYNPNIQKNPLKQGKSDEGQELDLDQEQDKDMDEEEEEEEA